MQELGGRVAVVTGAAGGIGEALALACAAEGMKVVCADVDAEAAEKTAAAIRAEGGEAISQAADVRRRSAMEAVADTAWSTFGGCHLLCNNAGVMVNKSLLDLEENDWRWILDVNLMGVVNGMSAFVPRMKAAGGEAHIVNTGSMAGLLAFGGIGLGAYTASKHAVVAVSEVLAQELAETPIGVSVLCPGAVATRIHESERIRPSELPGSGGLDLAEGANPQSMEGVQTPAEVAQTVLAGVRANVLHIITHPEMKPVVEMRHAAIADAFDAAAKSR